MDGDDCDDRRKSPGVPGAAMAIFADGRIKSPISGMSDIIISCARSRDVLRSSLRIATKVNQSVWAILSHDFSKRQTRTRKMTWLSSEKCQIAAIGV